MVFIYRNIHGALSVHKQICDGKKQIKQSTMDIFLKRMALSQEETEAGPSRGIAQEGIAIIGEDSSMCITGPEDLLVGQNVEMEYSEIDALDDPV